MRSCFSFFYCYLCIQACLVFELNLAISILLEKCSVSSGVHSTLIEACPYQLRILPYPLLEQQCFPCVWGFNTSKKSPHLHRLMPAVIPPGWTRGSAVTWLCGLPWPVRGGAEPHADPGPPPSRAGLLHLHPARLCSPDVERDSVIRTPTSLGWVGKCPCPQLRQVRCHRLRVRSMRQ